MNTIPAMSHKNVPRPNFVPFTEDELKVMAEAKARDEAEREAWLIQDEKDEAAKKMRQEGFKKRKAAMEKRQLGLQLAAEQARYLDKVNKLVDDEGYTDKEAREILGRFKFSGVPKPAPLMRF